MISTPVLKYNKKKKVIFLLLILLLPSFFYLILSRGNHRYKSLPFVGPKEILEESSDTLYHSIPNFELYDQDGNIFNNEDMLGNIVVVDFFFTRCPTICPKLAAHLLDIQNKFADRTDVIIVSHTVDPEHDSVEVLKEYAHKVHAKQDKWYFLTGEKSAIYDLAFKGYFASASKDEFAPGGFLHSELIFLVDPKGRLRGSYDDNGNIVAAFDGLSTSEMKKFADAIDNLLLENYAPLKKQK